ncbi:MAG: phosphatase PAP2 family protein [Chitinophagaceae bacterium]
MQTTIWQKLVNMDQWLFTQLNSVYTNRVFDSIMPFMRNAMHWSPVYLFLIVFMLLNFNRKGAWWCLFFTATVALTDMTGTYLFKNTVQRTRPCNDHDFAPHVRMLLDHCSYGFSFISNHAANHFAMAAFFYITMKSVLGKWTGLAFVWAGIVGYAQIYVGIHYPLDVLAGSLLGLTIGTLSGRLFNKRYGFAIFGNQPTLSS